MEWKGMGPGKSQPRTKSRVSKRNQEAVMQGQYKQTYSLFRVDPKEMCRDEDVSEHITPRTEQSNVKSISSKQKM